MNFDDRLKKAIERGQRRGEARQQADLEKAMSEEELKTKFLANAQRTVSATAAEELAETILDAQERPVRGLLSASQPAG